MNTQIIYFQSKVFHLPFITLKSTGFKCFTKIMGWNYVFCHSTRISFNPTSHLNSLSANFTKWSNTLKKVVANLPTNCLSVFGHFVGLVLKGLIALNDFVCVIIYHLFWCWVTLLLTLDNFLYFISFLIHPFIRHCLVQSQFIHIFYSTFYADWLWMVQCYITVLTIILMTYPW